MIFRLQRSRPIVKVSSWLVFLLSLLPLSPSYSAEGVSNQATAEAVIVNGFVVDIRVTFGGDGYFSPPAVSIIGTGSGAQAVASVQDGKVVDIAVTDAGFGYSTNTRVEIGPSSFPDAAEIELYAGIKLIGQVGSLIQLQVASSLDDPYPWFHLTNIIQTINPQIFFDPVAGGKRFYRALPVPTNSNLGQLAWIPPGSFTMGSPTNEPGHQPNEQEHLVSITKGFWIGRHEVTQTEYMQVLLATAGTFKGAASQPVETVSWDDATNYCQVLTIRELDAGRLPRGYVYRLPTEAEWEYAARAGSTGSYFFGNDPQSLPQYAWYATNSSAVSHTVATKTTNSWGLFDSYGNVAEWCVDWYEPALGSRAIDPMGPTNGSTRVVRGGNWNSSAAECRSATRDFRPPTDKNSGVGFRVALAAGTMAAPTNPNPSALEWIPSGQFMMGSPVGELDRQPDEIQHLVTLSHGFWVGKFEVTIGEFSDVTGTQIQGATNVAASSLTWNQATQYCQLLTQREQQRGRLPAGYVYRLPTEAEWEYVARSGTQTRFHFGDDLTYSQLGSYAWCFSNIAGGGFRPGGLKLPSPAGVYDLYGNASEWCNDWYGTYPSIPVTDPKGAPGGTRRSFRGGSYGSREQCRSAARVSTEPYSSGPGFRVVVALP